MIPFQQGMLDDPVTDISAVYIDVYPPVCTACNPGRRQPAGYGKAISSKFYSENIVFDVFAQNIYDPVHRIVCGRPVFNSSVVVGKPEVDAGPAQGRT
jgi:hypothetical protein